VVFSWLKRRKSTVLPPPLNKVNIDRFTSCIYCDSPEYYEGPTGGVAMNIKCAQCGARFNIGLIPGGPILIDKLSGPTEEPWRSQYQKSDQTTSSS